MGCARISLCLLIKKILPGRTARITALGFAFFTAFWTVSGVLVASFPCSLPNPWQSSGQGKTCIDRFRFVNYVGSTNIIVEILLISIPLCIWNVRTSAGRRMSVSLLFLSRLRYVANQAFIDYANNLIVLSPLLVYNYTLSTSGRPAISRTTSFPPCSASRSRRICPSSPPAFPVCTPSL